METKKLLIDGLMISIIICLFSCNHNKKLFYQKIKDNSDCMIAYDVVYDGENPITIVMEKSEMINEFNKFNQHVDDDCIIRTIKSGHPFSVSKTLYEELYGLQVIAQPRVDSLMNLGVNEVFIENKDNARVLKLNEILTNASLMEELYAIKKIFGQDILLKQDCESGFYVEIK